MLASLQRSPLRILDTAERTALTIALVSSETLKVGQLLALQEESNVGVTQD